MDGEWVHLFAQGAALSEGLTHTGSEHVTAGPTPEGDEEMGSGQDRQNKGLFKSLAVCSLWFMDYFCCCR